MTAGTSYCPECGGWPTHAPGCGRRVLGRFTQAQIDATARELHRFQREAGHIGANVRWREFQDFARKALEAGHIGVLSPGQMTPVQEPSEETTVHLSPGTRFDSDATITIEHEGGNTVRGTVEQVLSTHLAKGWRLVAGPEHRVSQNDEEAVEGRAPEPSEDEAKMRKSFASIAKMAEWWHGAADKVLERLRAETPEDVMLYHDAVSVLVSARSVFRIAELHAEGAPVAPPTEDVRKALEEAWDAGVARAGRYGHEDHWTHDMTPYSENPYRSAQ